MFCMGGLVYAQTHEGINNQLLGKWVLEDLSVFKIEGNDSIPVVTTTFNSEPFGIFNKLVFQENTLTVSMFGYNVEGDYNINSGTGQIDFQFASTPFFLEYQIRNNKLYLKQQLRYSYESSAENVYYVLSTYKSESDEAL